MTTKFLGTRRGMTQRNRGSAQELLQKELGGAFVVWPSVTYGTDLGEVTLDLVVADAVTKSTIAAFKLRRGPAGCKKNQKYDATLIPWAQFNPARIAEHVAWVKSKAA